ncbi:MAG: sigma-70 family RNA polymerase sigma factor [Planctomycetaceae bacterium]|nr:sigma-70 family RNA polymerase sigma factor [Planctomycetaceae bacterium]
MDSLPRTLAAHPAGASPVEAGDVRQIAAAEAEGHAALVASAQRGDNRAFAVLIELYQNTVYGFLRARLTEPADAEDLCQEVFLRCYLGREKLSRAAAVGPWLIGIARNLLREHVRRVHRRKEVAWTELCLELDSLASEHEQHHDEALAHLPVCLESLGQSAREAIDLRYRMQLRMAEIGLQLKRSEGAVKLLVHRARAALRHCLDRRLKKAS